MEDCRDACEVGIKVFRDTDWSPLWRDIPKWNEELPVTSVGGPALSSRLINRHRLHSVRQRESFLEFGFRHGRLVGLHRAGAARWNTRSRYRRDEIYRLR